MNSPMNMETGVNETMAAELERLESLLMDPAVRRDRERVAGLLAEDFLEFGSSGREWSRETTFELLQTETYAPPMVDCFACRMLGADIALVTYRAVCLNDATDERTITLRSSIWTKMSGDWKMRFHQGTPSGA
jgi:hypothetical protein